ncbi:hypothetical protein G6F65_023045 [Rhizopus arrhizus]|nr:hypothetical protein G6F65_023045 [Rhizopus arrhizus]
MRRTDRSSPSALHAARAAGTAAWCGFRDPAASARAADDDLEVACGIHAQDAPMRQIDAPQIAGAIERRPLQKRVHLHVARGQPA